MAVRNLQEWPRGCADGEHGREWRPRGAPREAMGAGNAVQRGKQDTRTAAVGSKMAKQESQLEQGARCRMGVWPVPASRRQDSQGANAIVTLVTDVTCWTLG